MKREPKKQSNTSVRPKAAGVVTLPKPNKGEIVRVGLGLNIFSHNHTRPKRSA